MIFYIKVIEFLLIGCNYYLLFLLKMGVIVLILLALALF